MHYCGTIRIVFRAMLIPASGTFNVSCPEWVFCQIPPFVPHFRQIGGRSFGYDPPRPSRWALVLPVILCQQPVPAYEIT